MTPVTRGRVQLSPCRTVSSVFPFRVPTSETAFLSSVPGVCETVANVLFQFLSTPAPPTDVLTLLFHLHEVALLRKDLQGLELGPLKYRQWCELLWLTPRPGPGLGIPWRDARRAGVGGGEERRRLLGEQRQPEKGEAGPPHVPGRGARAGEENSMEARAQR